jgi:hypothetical protein
MTVGLEGFLGNFVVEHGRCANDDDFHIGLDCNQFFEAAEMRGAGNVRILGGVSCGHKTEISGSHYGIQMLGMEDDATSNDCGFETRALISERPAISVGRCSECCYG